MATLPAPTPQFSVDAGADTDRFVAEARDILSKARALVEIDHSGAAGILKIDRARVFELLGRYQRFKHAVIFDPAIASGNAGQSAEAKALKCNCIMMGETFAAYVNRWQYVDVAEDWATYTRDMIWMNDELQRHIRVEHEAITNLLRGANDQ